MQGAPDQVHELHHVAAGFVGKKVKAQIAKTPMVSIAISEARFE
jgi:hypothetical protein